MFFKTRRGWHLIEKTVSDGRCLKKEKRKPLIDFLSNRSDRLSCF